SGTFWDWDDGGWNISVWGLYNLIDGVRGEGGIIVAGCTHLDEDDLAEMGYGDIVPGHAYTVEGVGFEDCEPVVYLRNPWGWRDEDHPPDGEFSMPLSDFRNIFTGMDYQDVWSDMPGDFTATLDAPAAAKAAPPPAGVPGPSPAPAAVGPVAQPAPTAAVPLPGPGTVAGAPPLAGGFLPVDPAPTAPPAGAPELPAADAPATSAAADPAADAQPVRAQSPPSAPEAARAAPPADSPFLQPLDGVTLAGIAV
ncbi:MAG TPA: hypothetical protein VH092_07530, partial [Urbifossiella sp.]|nr:hypothetical protein [Urbifossiella sp.]